MFQSIISIIIRNKSDKNVQKIGWQSTVKKRREATKNVRLFINVILFMKQFISERGRPADSYFEVLPTPL